VRRREGGEPPASVRAARARQGKTTFLQEIDHRIAVTSTNAIATQMDEDLDDLSDETSVVVPLATSRARPRRSSKNPG
jgi:hypothetical protein